MLEELATKISQVMKSILTDSATAEWVSSIVVLIVISLFKNVRDGVFRFLKRVFNIHTALNATSIKPLTKINETMTVLRNVLNADRVSLYQFHNGESFSLANPIFKLTCSHEIVKKGLCYESEKIKAVCVSNLMDLCSPLISTVVSDKSVKELRYCENCDNPKSCPVLPGALQVLHFDVDQMQYSYFKHVLSENGVQHAVATLLYSSNKKPIGIICAQYMGKEMPIKNKKHICAFCDVATSIQFVVDSLR